MEVPISVAIARSMHQAQAVARRGPDKSPSPASLYDKHLAQIEAELRREDAQLVRDKMAESLKINDLSRFLI